MFMELMNFNIQTIGLICIFVQHQIQQLTTLSAHKISCYLILVMLLDQILLAKIFIG